MNTMAQVVQVWLPLIVFQQIHAPRYYTGWVTVSVLNACLILATLGVWWLQKKENASRETGEDSHSKNGEPSEIQISVK